MRRVVLLCVASCFLVFAVSAGSAAGRESPSISPIATAAKADCSKAAALQAATPLHLADTTLPDPIAGVLCGAFTGPGSEAMVATFANGTCWPTSGWAVFRFMGGAWHIIPNGYRGGFVALAAVGSDIRETVPVWRKGDGPCNPTSGTKARIWHWDGTRLVAGLWKQVTKGEPERRGFYSPSHNIACGMYDDRSFRSVDCQSFIPLQKVKMDPSGRLTICRDRGTRNRCNIGNPGEGTPTLRYGREIIVGRFRCQSLRSAVRCTVIRSGNGFLINNSGVARVGR